MLDREYMHRREDERDRLMFEREDARDKREVRQKLIEVGIVAFATLLAAVVGAAAAVILGG